ncbi:hypothetical protein Tco_0320585 [Tanacetum coccineum]
MSTYLKNMAGYKQNQLKSKNYDEIQKLFDKAMTKYSKRAGDELEQEKVKKQKIDDDYVAEMKKHMEIVSDDEVAIDAIPLATKPPIIIDWKIIKEGKMGYFQIIRADGSSRRTQTDSLEAIFLKWGTFCEISESAYLYAGREKVSTYTCNNHRNAQQEASS